MKILTKFLLPVSVFFIIIGCSKEIKLLEYVDKDAPIFLSVRDSIISTVDTNQIIVNSEKYSKLMKWAEANNENWKGTPASFISELWISQGSFILRYSPGTDWVVISFTDKENKSRQYSKKINKGELDFLIEKSN